MILQMLRSLYRYIRYYRHDDYVSDKWINEFKRGDKSSIIII